MMIRAPDASLDKGLRDRWSGDLIVSIKRPRYAYFSLRLSLVVLIRYHSCCTLARLESKEILRQVYSQS